MTWGRDPRLHLEAASVRAETPRVRVEREVTPPKMFGLTRKAGYLALGIPMGFAAIGLWSFDILAHLTALPFDDVIFHGAAAAATVAAVPLLNAAWRGYGPSLGEIGKNTWSAIKSLGRGLRDSILKGARVIEGTNHVSEHETHAHTHGPRREEYDGRGYPVSATTYAREDLNGRYGSGRIKKAVSRTVLNFLGPLAHSARGIRDEAAERSHRVWSRDNPRGFFGKLGQTFTHVFLGGLWAGAKRGEESYKKDVADGNKYIERGLGK